MQATDEELDILRVRLCKIETPSTAHMMSVEKYQGITVMLSDLRRLAKEDGCIAAAWALETLDVLSAENEHTKTVVTSLADRVQKQSDLLSKRAEK